MSGIEWRKRTVTSNGVSLAVRESSGEGPAVIFLTGLGTPQSVWSRVAERISGEHRVITFDYRGHGRSGVAGEYSFDLLLDDVSAVLDATDARNPLLCGWSLGADLAVWHAAGHSDVHHVIALDGGIPAEPVAAEADWMDSWRARLLGGLARMFGAGVRMSTGELLALTDELHERRRSILDAYARVSCPVEVVLAETPNDAVAAGRTEGGTGQVSDETWRAGAHRLAAAYPNVPIRWLESDHAMPIRVPHRIADLIAGAFHPQQPGGD
ncbi:alpha/beta fold hydrolase [Phytoactinopolyspora mesophila]|uniref:Alpha/beta fold hydrolase n=1 Tax=Phytoactinopolyspora mesophila TaxID=2650750 RepID=A0A7K3M1V4_9ACTN|nr:alpha/beta hydrolase [Phytoactinopolyspora mesophila]NDL57273.1 alpha/beta fold hydrolase [Phytoactinopolyspora mesophila]